jgi:membrane complex biogenesis BtpA family protein
VNVFESIFGKPRAVIAMAHFPPLPGQPLYDAAAGLDGIRARVTRDLEVLGGSDVDAVMFGNEGDRPYRTHVGPETIATMAALITELKRDLPIPFGVDVLWDPIATIAVAKATGASFAREIFTGAYAGDFGIWNTDAAEALGFRRRIDASGIPLFFNIAAEFAAPLAPREIGLTARSAVFSALADAVCVSGALTGVGVDLGRLRTVKDAVGDVAVIANTGVTAETVSEILDVADGVIVGTSLKRDGLTWNEVDRDRVLRFVDAASRSGSWQPGRSGAPATAGA